MRPAAMLLGALLISSGGAGSGQDSPAPEPGSKPARKPNRLVKERSPYLLQHAQNPVDWFPWGPEALEKARQEAKPIFLSIGYSTCHWCHVMERESFENEDIASYLNEHFVSIKVDREERPDIDAIYMKAATEVQGIHGGWPLSAFLTPEGKPFFIGTYFPPVDDPRRGSGFLTVLKKIDELWRGNRVLVLDQAGRFTQELEKLSRTVREAAPLGDAAVRAGFKAFQDTFDEEHGGFGHVTKFPRPSALDFLLRYAARKTSRADGTAVVAETMVTTTLDAMLRGGIRDHLGGGFHRYATDRRWLVPHFEKMLYDQALITRTLLDAYRVTGRAAYRAAARETMDYVLRRLTGPSGELFSAEDADTGGVEGKTYTWRLDELTSVLGKERGERFAELHGATEEGGFEEGGPGANVLHLALDGGAAALAAKLGRAAAEVEAEIEADRAKLMQVRDARPQPFRDDKVIVEWNGLAISALAQLHQVTGEGRWLDAARRAAAYILERMTKDGALLRSSRGGEAAIPAFLADHAALADGLLDVYESDFDPRWLAEASRLAGEMLKLFEDREGGGFFSTGSRHEALITKTRDFEDGAIPSGNSMAFRVLLRLAWFTGDEGFEAASRRMEAVAGSLLEAQRGGHWEHPHLLTSAINVIDGAREIVIAGPPGDPLVVSLVAEVHRRYLPARVLLRTEPGALAEKLVRLAPVVEGKGPIGGKPAAFVCRGGVCKLPAKDLETFKKELDGE
ncbi:MAG TPA: thioredoxin domain-containing protein [Planctomycetota bacterium]|nr:thioredoxin domain-containing protein [Planctomycetota bacterium]